MRDALNQGVATVGRLWVHSVRPCCSYLQHGRFLTTVIAKPVRTLVVAIRFLFATRRVAYAGEFICFANVRRKGLVCIFAFGENQGFARSSPRERCSSAPHLNYSSPIPARSANKREDTRMGILSFVCGTPEGTRTPDLLVRSQSLYPTELPAHTRFVSRA